MGCESASDPLWRNQIASELGRSCPANLKYSNTQWAEFKNTPVWLTDLEVGYRFTEHWHLAIGANNIFNQRPRHVNPINNYLGPKVYDTDSSGIPIYGAYYYGRLNATF